MARHDPLAGVSTRTTPQSRSARADQVANSAGGFVFAVDDLTRLRRFLTLGVEGGTYYVTQIELTAENAPVVLRLARSNPGLVVDEVVAISTAGRAPKQNPALFALAAVAGVADAAGRAYALERLGQVARTGTHLALFTTYVQQFRGWGRQLRR
ncbi:MAG: TROVE domain-containing protein, partial [Azoarcus sp.]|nr:TROVE domain-containing protein [Azoarcus sp.]